MTEPDWSVIELAKIAGHALDRALDRATKRRGAGRGRPWIISPLELLLGRLNWLAKKFKPAP
jgi:hypothetical protein